MLVEVASGDPNSGCDSSLIYFTIQKDFVLCEISGCEGSRSDVLQILFKLDMGFIAM